MERGGNERGIVWSPTIRKGSVNCDCWWLFPLQEHYGLTIKDMIQPLLVCRPKEKDRRAGRTENTFLVPELCVQTGLTEEVCLAHIRLFLGFG